MSVFCPSQCGYAYRSFRAQNKAERLCPVGPGICRGVTDLYPPRGCTHRRNTRDRSITRSLQIWVLIRNSLVVGLAAEAYFLLFKVKLKPAKRHDPRPTLPTKTSKTGQNGAFNLILRGFCLTLRCNIYLSVSIMLFNVFPALNIMVSRTAALSGSNTNTWKRLDV